MTDSPDLLVSFPIIYFFFQETKQKTLEEIDLLFEKPTLDQIEEVVALESEKEMGVSATNVEGADVRS